MYDIPDKVHFIGIGGAGMSGLARVLLDQGYSVRGSDLNSGQATGRLEALGATVYQGHCGSNIKDAQLVVVSTAIGVSNPELQEARANGIPVIHRADLLSRLMETQKGLAVAGAHGKTTTTSMLALVLEKCHQDPTILIGGDMNEFGGNAKLGRGECLVAEADESDGSFLKLRPHLAIVTNIEEDHLDYYGTLQKIISTFRQFLQNIEEGGAAVLCFDDANVRDIAAACRCQVISYALDYPGADLRLHDIQLTSTGSSGEVYFRNEYLGRLELAVPGLHNLSNALAVIAACQYLGLDPGLVMEQLKDFLGVGRRYQTMGQVRGVTVVDDYAHHPTEILATLRAARQMHPGRIIAVFQPHRYTRTAALHQRFGSSFKAADLVIINDIYNAGEKPMAGITAQLIVDAARACQCKQVLFLPGAEQTIEYLMENHRSGDLVLTMGAGDVWKTGLMLLDRLKEM